MKQFSRIITLGVSFIAWSGSVQTVHGTANAAPHAHHNGDRYFDASFLNNHQAVYEALRSEGFTPVRFRSSGDHLVLNGLYRPVQNARATLIVCGGFYPGRKETYAHFSVIFPDFNILLFDARGHGKSQGSLFGSLSTYGLSEFQDIIGAIAFVHKNTRDQNTPVFLYGCCAGTFHAAHALIKLEQANMIQQLNIKGFIFDSGYGSLTTAAEQTPRGELSKRLTQWLKLFLRDRNTATIQQNFTYKLLYGICSPVLNFISSFFTRSFRHREPQTNLFNKIHLIPVPIYYIHSVDDNFSPFNDIQRLAQLSQHPQTWWIGAHQSYHAEHNRKLRAAYTNNIREFCNNILTQH